MATATDTCLICESRDALAVGLATNEGAEPQTFCTDCITAEKIYLPGTTWRLRDSKGNLSDEFIFPPF